MRRPTFWTACIVLISFLMFVEDISVAAVSPWVTVSNMITARDQFAGCVIGDKIYVFGGNGNPDGINLKSGEVYDTTSFSWSPIADNHHNDPENGVEEVTGAAVGGKFYVFGGWGGIGPHGNYGVFNFNEVYDPAANTWTTLAPKPTTTRSSVPAVYNGKIYLFGGSYEDQGPGGDEVCYNVVEVYDTVNDTWQSEANMPKTLLSPAIAVYGDSAYIIGGWDVNANKMNTKVMAYNFVSKTWDPNYCTASADATRAYSFAGPTPVVDGKAYLIGGSEGTFTSHRPSKKFTIFDINSKQWQTGPLLPEPRSGHLVVVYNNEVYVIGGYVISDKYPKNTVYCLSADKKTSAVFNDNHGTPVTLSVTGGGWYEIAGDNNDFSSITLHNTTGKSIFAIKTPAGQYTSIGDIIVRGSLNAISAKTTDLRGNITIDGTIGKIELHNIDSDHKITIGHASNPKDGVLMKFDKVNDLSIDSNTPIKILMCTRWLDNDANKDYIKAPSLGTLQVKGDSKNNIAGDFGCDLRLDGNSVTGATLTNVKIAGDVKGHSWNITGDVRTLQAGGWIDSNMVIDGNVASLKLNQLHGDVNVMGNAAIINIAEPMAVWIPDANNCIGELQVGGKTSVKSGRNIVKFTKGTLYTSEPNMYRLEDLRMYDSLGANWNYQSNYKITGLGVAESGSGTSSITIQPSLLDFYGHDCSVVETCDADGVCISTAWYTDVVGTHLASWAADDSGTMIDLSVNAAIIEREFLKLGELYKDSGSFGGDIDLGFTDDYDNEVTATIAGTALTSCKLAGHEQVAITDGTLFLAAKIELSLTMTGYMQVGFDYDVFNCRFTINQKQTYWAVPGIGIVKAVASTSMGLSAAELGNTSVKITSTDTLTDYSIP